MFNVKHCLCADTLIRGDLHMYVVESKWNLCSLVGGGSLVNFGLGEVYYSYPKEPPPTLG